MTSTCVTEDPKLAVLHQLFASATHDASAAMCQWTDGLITLTLDEVRELPLAEATHELDLGDQLLTMVVLSLEGDIGGEMILTFDEENGRQLVASLLGRPVGSDPEWSDLEKSALTETGNILGCAYMNAITRLINHELVPTAPYFIQDYGASVLQQALMVQAMTSDHVLVCRTGFHRAGEELNWRVLFVPTAALREAMERALHRRA
ncbi:MAG: chemotaxis protein [Thermoguttaceae bacterium]|jgi:chemotaxis protein CheC|nr:chemotaxis protein [Thermoguttaceae bacterium]